VRLGPQIIHEDQNIDIKVQKDCEQEEHTTLSASTTEEAYKRNDTPRRQEPSRIPLAIPDGHIAKDIPSPQASLPS